MERSSDLSFEMACARFNGKMIDEWWEKPEEVRIAHMEDYKNHIAKEAYYATDKEDRFFFFQGGRRKD